MWIGFCKQILCALSTPVQIGRSTCWAHPTRPPPRNYRAKWERGNRARFLSVHPPHNNYSRKYHSDRGSGAGGGGRMSSRSRGSLLPSHKCKTEKILIHLTRLEIDRSRRNCGWHTSVLPHSTFFRFFNFISRPSITLRRCTCHLHDPEGESTSAPIL